jgi:hypothetical protein
VTERPHRLGLVLAAAAATAVLVAAGRGSLATPPLDDLPGWIEDRGTLVAAMAAVRLLGLAAAAWLLLVALVGEAARLAGATRLVLLADRALPAVVRNALGAVAGVGVIAGGVAATVGPPAAGSVAPPPAVATQQLLPPEGEAPGAGAAAVARMTVLPPDPEPAPAPAPVPAPVPDRVATAAPAAEEWTVAPGESFWSIAEDVVAERSAQPPSDDAIAAYWRVLVDANRGRLVAGDPDVIWAGQRLVLPD